MKSRFLLLIITAVATIAGRGDGSSPVTAFSSIPPQQPTLYSSVKTWEAWHNPRIVIRDNGIFINDSTTATPTDKLLEVLAKLPSEAWPYGRIIAVSAFPGFSSKNPTMQKLIVESVLEMFKSANIEVLRWPSA